MHFSDAIIYLLSSALVGGNVHKLGKDSRRKSLKIAGRGSILEDIFCHIKNDLIFADVNYGSGRPNQIKWRPTFGSRPWG